MGYVCTLQEGLVMGGRECIHNTMPPAINPPECLKDRSVIHMQLMHGTSFQLQGPSLEVF